MFMHRSLLVAVFLILFSALQPVLAAGDKASGFRSTDLPLPRFVSLKSDRVYVRTGPAQRYPIRWVYERQGLPVEITQEFESWRKIRDSEGEEGWIHQSMLSGERSVLITGDDLVTMRAEDRPQAPLVARVEPRVIARVEKCTPVNCRIEAGGFRGWVQRNFLWGIYANEEFN